MHDKVVLKVYLRFATGLLLSPLWTPFLHVRGPPESDGVGVSLCESGFLIQQLSVDEAYISSRCLNVHSNSIYVSQSNIDGPLSSLSAWGLQVRFSLHFSSILVGPMARFRLIERPLNWTYSSVLNEVPVQFHSVRTLKRTVILEKKNWILNETHRLRWLHIHSILFLEPQYWSEWCEKLQGVEQPEICRATERKSVSLLGVIHGYKIFTTIFTQHRWNRH